MWLEIVALAHDLIVWTQALTLDGELAKAEPKRLRYQLLHVAGRLFITNNLHFTSPDGRSVSATLSLDAFVFGIASPVPVGPTGASGSTG